jgi:cytochrome c-type biogenesis protein CcmE
MKARAKFLTGSGIIVVTLAALAYVGYTQSKTYYHTISELSGLSGSARNQRMRVSGNVREGSILRQSGRVDFVLEEQGRVLPIIYVGRDPLPDTFKDGAQALVEGRLNPDGHFVAEQVQAKCASKYEATPNQTPGTAQPGKNTSS